MRPPSTHPILARGRRRVFAHRGGSLLAPENTIAAFDRAVALGVDGLELDVRLSADGVPVVIHDATVDRTTDGRGAVASFTALALADLDAGCRCSAAGERPWAGRGTGVPTLQDVLVRYPQMPLIVELKGDDPALAHAAYDDVRAAHALGRVCFGGFSGRTLEAVRQHEGVVSGAAREEIRWALYRSWIGLTPRCDAYDALQVPEVRQGHRIVSPRFVRLARRAGLVVHVWTVNEPDDMSRLLTWGVDALITDRPDLAVDVVSRWNHDAQASSP